jgi:4-amino-4-deoxy-L-arabinose transferase-like glycosyltransferase
MAIRVSRFDSKHLNLASFVELMQKTRFRDARWLQRSPDWLAATAACVFILLATYRIKLPGLYYDELIFVNAAQGAPDNTFIHMRLGSLPLFVMPYLGALKAWIYAPIFRLFGVSALTIRLPVILIAAMTLLIFYIALRGKLGAIWAAIVVFIMAIDPANLFPSRLDWGPTVLMHFFQASILALWFSYRDRPGPWKLGLIFVCFALGFFDKFNFIWLVSAFLIAICCCYPDSVKNLWISSPRFVRYMATVVGLLAVATVLYLISRLSKIPSLAFEIPSLPILATRLQNSWHGTLSTLSGAAVAAFVFGSPEGMIRVIPFWIIVGGGVLALASLFVPRADAEARDNRKNGFFCLLSYILIFLQIVITPQANGPHHHSMIFPLHIFAFAFFAKSLCTQFARGKLGQLAALLLGAAAVCVFAVNLHNTRGYLFHFRSNSHYNPRWSPEIYTLSHYVNEQGAASKSIISADWGLHNQLHALAPPRLRRQMRDCWPIFKELAKKNQKQQNATLTYIFPEGKSLVLTFAASKETFPETRRNFLASLAAHTELQLRLAKQFRCGNEEIYDVYEVVRLSSL